MPNKKRNPTPTGAGKTRAQMKKFTEIMLQNCGLLDPHESSPLLGKMIDTLQARKLHYLPPDVGQVFSIDFLQMMPVDDGFIDGAGI